MESRTFEHQIQDAAVKAGGLLRSKYGIWFLGLVSFAESALVVPLITDPFLVAYILADRAAAVRALVVTLITSVLGGLFAYAIAFWFYEFIAAQYLHGAIGAEFSKLAAAFREGELAIVLLGAITPVPYTLVAMAAGFVKASVLTFIVGSFLGRLFRYGILAWLTYHYGQQALAMAQKQIPLVTIVCFILAALYFYFKF